MLNQIEVKKNDCGFMVTVFNSNIEKQLKKFDNEKDALQFARLYDSNYMSKKYKIVVK